MSKLYLINGIEQWPRQAWSLAPQSLLSEGTRWNINRLCGKFLVEQNLSTKWTLFLLVEKKKNNIFIFVFIIRAPNWCLVHSSYNSSRDPSTITSSFSSSCFWCVSALTCFIWFNLIVHHKLFSARVRICILINWCFTFSPEFSGSMLYGVFLIKQINSV